MNINALHVEHLLLLLLLFFGGGGDKINILCILEFIHFILGYRLVQRFHLLLNDLGQCESTKMERAIYMLYFLNIFINLK